MDRYVIGVDFGTDSCRVLILHALTGEEIASSIRAYPRWGKGLYCDAARNQYRQHPADYIEALEDAVNEALTKLPAEIPSRIEGIGIDTTGSTPALTDRNGTPLALLDEFTDNPNAMFVLWKDHSAIDEADEITQLAKRWEIDYTSYQGGIYSSEWVWAKVLYLLREDESLRKAAYSWVEHCDWIPGLLTGNTKPETMFRSRCAAGHKAMWHPDWKGLPGEDFLERLDPLLINFRKRLFRETFTSDTCVGYLTPEWASRLGLSTRVAVAAGAFDCHMGAVGAGIKPHMLVKSIGTSTCDIMVATHEDIGRRQIPGICGQVDGSVLPGMIGLEAGQSAFGDIFAWFRQILEWPMVNILPKTTLISEELMEKIIAFTAGNIFPVLSDEAGCIPFSKEDIVSTDWFNGRRTPYANQRLRATISGLSLGSSAPLVFRSLVEAASFGSRSIVEHFSKNGITIHEVVSIGGIPHKSPFVMQILADVIGIPVKVANSTQCCALGAAMFATVAAKIHPDIESAQSAMSCGYDIVYRPDECKNVVYRNSYAKYLALDWQQSVKE